MGFTINKGLGCFVLIFYPYLEMTYSREACLNSAILKLIHRYPHIDRFTVAQKKKYIGNHPVEEAKRTKCYERLIYKQFVQVSGPCGPQFLSYLPKRFTHLCRALYGDAILVYRFGAPIWPPEINQNIWSLLFLQKLFLSTRLARKHIF